MQNKSLKIVHIVASDRGGAFRAAKRINDALCVCGLSSEVVVLEKRNEHSNVTSYFTNKFKLIVFKVIRELQAYKLKKMNLTGLAYESRLGVDLWSLQQIRESDVINIHWVNDGMISYRDLKKLCNSGKTIVWTMHDMFPFTAACYYDKECGGYMDNCKQCPFVENVKNGQAFIDKMYSQKAKAYKGKISFVGCSRWIAQCAKNSTLCKNHYITSIPNPIELDVFKPLDSVIAYSILLQIKKDSKKIILFGAMSATSNERKGYSYLLEALKRIKNKEDYKLVVFGGSKDYKISVDIECISIGNVNDDNMLAAMYSIADVFVAPSVQENLSNAVMEALACGTPVVAFNIGGMNDMIEHKTNGFLAKPFDADSLCEGIEWTVIHKNDITINCRNKVCSEFSMNRIGSRYKELFEDLISKQ